MSYSTVTGLASYRPPERFPEFVHDLVKGFVLPAGSLASAWSRKPLLVQLQDQLGPGRGSQDQGKRRGKGAGSPAPWNGQVGSLLDEVRRGAVARNNQARAELGYRRLQVPWLIKEPNGKRHVRYVPAGPADDYAARAALAGLPTLLANLGDASDLAGLIERDVRSWHLRARMVLGYESPWPRVTEVQLADGSWRTARCPYCGHGSLRQNPGTGAVLCTDPSCRDDQGRRYEWDPEDLPLLGRMLQPTRVVKVPRSDHRGAWVQVEIPPVLQGVTSVDVETRARRRETA